MFHLKLKENNKADLQTVGDINIVVLSGDTKLLNTKMKAGYVLITGHVNAESHIQYLLVFFFKYIPNRGITYCESRRKVCV